MERKFELGGGGALWIREEGLRARFSCERPDDKRGLYKAYIKGVGGRLLLGTMIPEGGRLGLCRTWSVDELTRKGFWPVTGGEAELSFSFENAQARSREGPAGWSRERDPSRLLGDKIISGAAGAVREALYSREEEGFALAIPYEENGAFPIQPLFCFAYLETIESKPYVVFHFNARGCPVFRNRE